jgi:hypothetical protein
LVLSSLPGLRGVRIIFPALKRWAIVDLARLPVLKRSLLLQRRLRQLQNVFDAADGNDDPVRTMV